MSEHCGCNESYVGGGVVHVGSEACRYPALKSDRDAIPTAVRVMLEGKPGAANNAVHEDYRDLAAVLDPFVRDHEAALEAIRRLRDFVRDHGSGQEALTLLQATDKWEDGAGWKLAETRQYEVN